MTIKLEEAMKIYNDLQENKEMTTKRAGTIEIKECEENGWTYTFFFYKGTLKKIEAYNHRELIENYVK